MCYAICGGLPAGGFFVKVLTTWLWCVVCCLCLLSLLIFIGVYVNSVVMCVYGSDYLVWFGCMLGIYEFGCGTLSFLCVCGCVVYLVCGGFCGWVVRFALCLVLRLFGWLLLGGLFGLWILWWVWLSLVLIAAVIAVVMLL